MGSRELTLEEIHKETIEILKKIMSICEKLDINYFIYYGSLLGAVRHKGFIPWDDDFDIAMLRPQFDKFKSFCYEHADDLYPYKLLGRENTENYPFTIPRFCDLRYKMKSNEISDVGMGMFIDIYPFDGLGNNLLRARKTIENKRKILRSGANYASGSKFSGSQKGFIYTFGRYLIYLYSKIKGTQYFLDKLENLKNIYCLDESKYIDCVVWSTDFNPIEKVFFESFDYLQFEGIKVKVPKHYDEILKIIYGDYMQLPPEKDRIPHHEYSLYKNNFL